MTKSPWSDPPLTRTPLDYVPIDAPIRQIIPTRFKMPKFKRALLAAVVAAALVGLCYYFPQILIGGIAIGVIALAAWGGGKLTEGKDGNQ